ncbi:hypothetical protein F2Q68_00040158 [Brassica cretica]|uniref:Uncharacterized protein n=1 Tax=Brassica cretica TaxID=69181 RepID=A0A8S9MKU4_BRACR|nr:hypothetical protein F2Q68_00040158 [Brassica cretica]
MASRRSNPRDSDRVRTQTGSINAERIRSRDVSEALTEVLPEETRLLRASAQEVSKPMNYFFSEENLETMNVTEDMEIPEDKSRIGLTQQPRVNLSETGQNPKPTSVKEDYWSVTDASAHNIHTPLCAPTLLCRSWSSLRPPFFLASLRPTIARYRHQGLALQLQSLAIFKL